MKNKKFKSSDKEKDGFLVLRASIINEVKNNIMLEITSDIKINNLNQFYILYKNNSVDSKGENWIKIYKSEVLNPSNNVYCPVLLNPYVLYGNEKNKQLKIELHDYWNKNLIGEMTTNPNLLDNTITSGLTTIKNGQPCKLKNAEIKIKCFEVKKETFLDYLAAGLQISILFGIDFSKSNGSCYKPSSLHYFKKHNSEELDISSDVEEPTTNLYQKAIMECGNILATYDWDKQFPVFGFGARYPGEKLTNHCFPVNMNNHNPNIYGIDNLLKEYENAVKTMVMDGPSLFLPLIMKAIEITEQDKIEKNNNIYKILMIFTDGELKDMTDTIDAIIEAAHLPISIIIIGIGNSEFNLMDKLDSDEDLLIDSNGRKAVRDIVQFVPYKNFNDMNSLQTKVLSEITSQVVDYFKMKDIHPKEPIKDLLKQKYYL